MLEDSFSFNIKGIEQVTQKLDYGVRKVNRGSNKALKEGAEVMAESIRRHTPVRTGKAQGSVMVGNVSTKGGTDKSVKVGYPWETAYYMWFVNSGTYSKGNPKGIAPRHHVEDAKAEGDPMAEAMIADFIAKLIDSI